MEIFLCIMSLLFYEVSGEYVVVAVVLNHKRLMSPFVLLLCELHALFCVKLFSVGMHNPQGSANLERVLPRRNVRAVLNITASKDNLHSLWLLF